jgi:hypothetical protein
MGTQRFANEGILETALETNPQLTQGHQEDDFKKVVEAYYTAWIFWVSTPLITQNKLLDCLIRS